MAGLSDEVAGQGDLTVRRNEGQTDQVPNLEKAGVGTQARSDTGRELGAGHRWSP